MNEFKDTAGEFYKDLQKGRVEQKDFERHIYGQYGGKAYYKDNLDTSNEEAHSEKQRIESDFQAYIDR